MADRGMSQIAGLIERMFNDESQTWPEFENYEVFDEFSPYALASTEPVPPVEQKVFIPRSAKSLEARFRGPILAALKRFCTAYAQSGRGSFEDWNYANFPHADLLRQVGVTIPLNR